MKPGHTGEVRRDALDRDIQLSGDGLELALLGSDEKERANSRADPSRINFIKKNRRKQKVTRFLMSASSLRRSSVEILLLSCRCSGENLPSMSKLPWASLNTCLERHSRKATAESQPRYVLALLRKSWENVALCLTWPPRRRASCTDPGADTSAWPF